MIEVRNPEREIWRLRVRLGIAWVLVLACFGILGSRFFYLQITRYPDFHAQAEDNRIALVPVPPRRGLIYDRNGVLLADNVPDYTLEIAPRRVENLDATIDALAEIVEITDYDRRRFKRLLGDARNQDTVPIRARLSDEELARFAAMRYRFPGVEIRARLFRTYPMGESAAHVIGYIGRISAADMRRLDENERLSEYAGSTHIGKTGVESSYERTLHGRTGFEEVEVSASGRPVRSLSHTPPVAGANLILSIDIELQKRVEEWFGDRRGALVAIEPRTGDVLAMVSSPRFDPNLFVDGIDVPTWQALNDNPDNPMLNRPLRGTYPPGSTYKPFLALAALGTGARTPEFTISDPGYFQLGNHRFRDSRPSGHGTVNLFKSIVVSSDTYYYRLAYEMGVDAIHDSMKPWGFGQLTGIDLEHETAGILPSSDWKFKRYKKRWHPGETPSVGIGQGYNAFTILQLAHATATLANGGVVMRPHVVRAIEDPLTRERSLTVRTPSHTIPIDPKHLELVRSAMVEVNRVGTSRRVFQGAEYVAAGKTGTSQVIGIRQGERYDARRIAERHRDHSLFMAFAPADAPRLALAVIVENGGFGAQAAAPIARKVFDFHLLGKRPGDPPGPSRNPAASAGAAAAAASEETEDEEALRDVPAEREPEQLAPGQDAR